MLKLLYGCGLRMNELLRLRIKDIDFGFDKVFPRSHAQRGNESIFVDFFGFCLKNRFFDFAIVGCYTGILTTICCGAVFGLNVVF